MTNKGIIFNGKHSYKDMGVKLSQPGIIEYPQKKKIKVTPPHSNTTYDFSELYGSQPYSERTLRYQFNIVNRHNNTFINTRHLASTLSNWLLNSNGKQRLIDPHTPHYHYLAEVEGDLALERLLKFGVLDVTFTAYPFRISNYPEGEIPWDAFNFDFDVAQEVKHTVNGTKVITLYNTGTPNVVPTVITSAPIKVTKGNVEYSFSAGTSKNDSFQLPSGEHELTLKGNGTIEFIFYKELI